MDGQDLPQEPDQLEPEVPEDDERDPSTVYWATLDGPELIEALDAKERAYFQAARSRGLITMWIGAYAALHGLNPDDLTDMETAFLGLSGSEMQEVRFYINKFASFASQKTTISLGERPAFQALSVNTDHKSQISAQIADELVRYLYRRYANEDHEREVAIGNITLGACSGHCQWDAYGGDMVTVDQPLVGPDGSPLLDPQTGQPRSAPVKRKSGAPVVGTVYPWGSFKEPMRVPDASNWTTIRENGNKFDLAAKFPDLADDILKEATSDDYEFSKLFGVDAFGGDKNEDACIVKHFYHPDCAAIPGGRYVMYYGKIVLRAAKCPVSEGIPVAEMCTSRYMESSFGRAAIWDLMPMNQAMNELNSSQLTNYMTFGRNSVAMEEGTKISAQALIDGNKVFEYPHGGQLPQVVQMIASPPQVDAKLQYLNEEMQDLSQLSATSRGDPAANIRSGEMAALIDSISLRFAGPDQAAVNGYRVKMANMLLDMVQQYGQSAFLAEVVGIDNRPFVQEFTTSDLSTIKRAYLDTVSPIMQTVAGRLQMFIQLVQLPPEQRPAAYELITTGLSDRFVSDDRSKLLLIQRENELLLTGERAEERPVQALAIDNIIEHVTQHVRALDRLRSSDNPDPAAMQRFFDHLSDHQQAWFMLDPYLAGFLGIPPPPPIPPGPSAPAGNASWQQMQLAMQTGAPPPGTDSASATGGPAAPAAGGGAPAPSSGAPPKQEGTLGSAIPNPSQPSQAPAMA